jgi:hypothetical protein
MKIFEVTENIDDQYELFVDGRPATAKLYNKKEINAVKRQWQMKFPKKKIEFKIVNKYATEDRADGAKTAQAMKRAGMDVDNVTFNKTANQNFSGTDAVDQLSFKGKQGDERRQKAIDAKFDAVNKKQKQQDRDKERDQAYLDARERSKKERQDRKDAAKDADDQRGDAIQGKVDRNKGYRKSADGRTLRDPRYYKDDPSGKGKPQGAIGKGLDRLRADPAYAISKYYNDKVDQVKDFLNQRI